MGYPHFCSWSIFPSFAIIGDIGKSGAALKEFKAFKTDSNMDKARRTWDDQVSEWFIKHLQASVARAFRLLPFRPLRFLTGGWTISEGCPLSPCFPRLLSPDFPLDWATRVQSDSCVWYLMWTADPLCHDPAPNWLSFSPTFSILGGAMTQTEASERSVYQLDTI